MRATYGTNAVAVADVASPTVSAGKLERLGDAVRAALGERSQAWLAEQIGIDASVVSKLIAGQQQGLALERVAEIEEVLELAPGALLRAGGYVADAADVREAIIGDDALSVDAKRTVLGVYELARRTS